MVIPYRSAPLASCALKPGLGSLRLTACAIAVAAAIASSPALADGKNKEGKNKSANFGPVVPNITTGVGNFNRQANFVVASIPAATNTTNVNNFTPPSGAGPGLSKVETGNSGPGPSALPVTAIGNGAGVKSGGVAGNDAGVPLTSRENGQLLLAPGQSIEIADPDAPNLRVVVTARGHQSLDIGKIVANTERSGIYAALAEGAGPPRANGVTLASDGRVMLTSNGNRGSRGDSLKSNDSHGKAIGRDRWEASDSPGHRSVERDQYVKVASVNDKRGTRDDSSRRDDSHKHRTHSNGSHASGSPGLESVVSNPDVNATSLQRTANYAVTQQTDADRDATLKTSDTVTGNTAKRDSSKSKSGVCS